MILHTASEGITLAKKLEHDSARFYEELAQWYTQGAETFLSFAKDNKKNIALIERVYYGVITDALEGGFAFKINTDDYSFEATLSNSDSYSDALNRAIHIEEQTIKFYLNAAEQSAGLLADVPRNFKIIAERKQGRIDKLQHLMREGR